MFSNQPSLIQYKQYYLFIFQASVILVVIFVTFVLFVLVNKSLINFSFENHLILVKRPFMSAFSHALFN